MEEINNFERREVGHNSWNCKCKCGKEFTIRGQPKNWEFRKLLKNNHAWSSEFHYEDLIVYCSKKCKFEDNLVTL